MATRSQLQVPIESVPIGARVPTKNANRFEVAPQPEPDQASWAKLSITVERSDGGIVDAEIIRPRSWILRNGICAGRMLPLNLPELEVSGLALVTAIDDCPSIADGEGSVVTARFVTREVHVVASVDVLGADGTVETITGTTIHPVWSVDRQEWVPLAELAQGEGLCCDTESLGLGFPSSLSPKASGLVLSPNRSTISKSTANSSTKSASWTWWCIMFATLNFLRDGELEVSMMLQKMCCTILKNTPQRLKQPI